MRQRKQLYIITSLICMALLLRLPNLFKLGLWRDEGSTYFDALPAQWSEVIKTVIYSELNPPAFFIVMHQWMQWFGAEEVVFKLPALFFGLLLIPAIYWLGSTAYSKKTGVLAAALEAMRNASDGQSRIRAVVELAQLLAKIPRPESWQSSQLIPPGDRETTSARHAAPSSRTHDAPAYWSFALSNSAANRGQRLRQTESVGARTFVAAPPSTDPS